MDSVPGQGTKVPRAAQCDKKTKIKQSNPLPPIKKAMLYKRSAGLEMEALPVSRSTNSLSPVPSSVIWILFPTLPSSQELAGSGGKVEL